MNGAQRPLRPGARRVSYKPKAYLDRQFKEPQIFRDAVKVMQTITYFILIHKVNVKYIVTVIKFCPWLNSCSLHSRKFTWVQGNLVLRGNLSFKFLFINI